MATGRPLVIIMMSSWYAGTVSMSLLPPATPPAWWITSTPR